MNDDFIKKKLRAKDKTAFESVFTYYYSGLCAFSNHLIDDRDAAEDLVQDFFANFWKQCSGYEIKGSIKSFLFQSIRNSSLDYLKHRKVVGKYKEQYRFASELATEPFEYAQDELQEIINKAIEKLAPRCREIFLMSRFNGFSNQEIAEKLEISKRTVELQISKAIKSLKEVLSSY